MGRAFREELTSWLRAALAPLIASGTAAALLMPAGAATALASTATPAATTTTASTTAASTLSLRATRAMETAAGPARTAAVPGGGYLVVHAFGTVSMVGASGRLLWARDTASLYRAWGVRWQSDGPVTAPELAWGTSASNQLTLLRAGAPVVSDATPYAVGDLGVRPTPDVAVAETVGFKIYGQISSLEPCQVCLVPFDVAGSSLHVGTFVTILDGRTGRVLWHELDPGYVTQLAITGGRLIVGDETGDPAGSGWIGAFGSVSSVHAVSFRPAGAGLAGHRAWTYSTGAPWARLLGLTATSGAGVTVAWSDTPTGLGVPGPPHGHVLLLSSRSGRERWSIRTPGYPVLLGADARRARWRSCRSPTPRRRRGIR